MKNSDISIRNYNVNLVLERLNELGVVSIPGFISAKTLSLLNDEFDEFLQTTGDEEYSNRTPYSAGECARIETFKLPAEQFITTKRVFSHHFMEKLAKAYFKAGAFNLNREIFVVRDVVGSKHIANDLHFDVDPTLKFFIYLSDTTKMNGAFSCVPGSHRVTAGIRKKFPYLDYNNREITREHDFSENEIVPIEGTAGTLIIFTTETFHRAGFVSQGERRVMRGHTRLKNEKKKNIFSKLFWK